MKYYYFSMLLLASLNVSACPNQKEVQSYLSSGNINGVKVAEECGFDLHRESDKALYIASIYSQEEVVEYLISRGLKHNAEYVQNAIMRDYFYMKSLNALASLYELDTRKKLNQDSWYQEFVQYLEKRGESASVLVDAWGRRYLYKGRKDDLMNPHVFCTLGRDGELNGELYDKDVCSNDDLDKLKQELNSIGFF